MLDGRVKYGQFYPGNGRSFNLTVSAEGSSEEQLALMNFPMKECIKVEDVREIENYGRGEFPYTKNNLISARARQAAVAAKPRSVLGVSGNNNNNNSQKSQSAKPAVAEADNQAPPARTHIIDAEDSDFEEEVPNDAELIAAHFENESTLSLPDAVRQQVDSRTKTEMLNGPLAEAFRRSHGKVPFVATISGADLRKVVNDANLRELPTEEWMGYAQATMKGHLCALRLAASRIDPMLPLADGLIAMVEALRLERKWRWSTTLKNATTLQGALSVLPLYYRQCPSICLKEWALWKKEVSHLSSKTKEEVPNQAVPATSELVDRAIRQERLIRPQIAVALMLGWLTAARLGCILQLEKEDIINQQGRLAVTFKRGKGVRCRGPYTVDTQPLPPEWRTVFESYVSSRIGSRLFPKSLQGSDLCRALRNIDRSLEQRSIRRGSLQTMAANGVDEKTLMRFSGHTQVTTLRRYLNWNKVNSNVQALMASAAVSLIPATMPTTPAPPPTQPQPPASSVAAPVSAPTSRATKKPAAKASRPRARPATTSSSTKYTLVKRK